jgi:hypothetical protein
VAEKKAAARPAKKRAIAPRRRRRNPDHAAIAERAYFIHLENHSSDELENWFRAERELVAA